MALSAIVVAGIGPSARGGDVVVVGRLGAQEVERLVRSQPRLLIIVTIGHIMKQLASAFATPFEDSGGATEEEVRKRWDRN